MERRGRGRRRGRREGRGKGGRHPEGSRGQTGEGLGEVKGAESLRGGVLTGGNREMRGLGEDRLRGTKLKVLKRQAKRPGARRRKEARGEARGAELPRAPRPRRANRGGRDRPTAAGRWQGQLQIPGKAAPEPTHLSVQTAGKVLRALHFSGPEPWCALVPNPLCPLSGEEPSALQSRTPRAGRPATESRHRMQLLTARKAAGGTPAGKFRHNGAGSFLSQL
uniref:uncharacterized protein LOC128929829 n=1 Tax=Callithrix jacchus TaxID=9483 RepID=UPI0023DD17AD|nr:uncharacterized protein LOC128929829 [Callithrix jacchus]